MLTNHGKVISADKMTAENYTCHFEIMIQRNNIYCQVFNCKNWPFLEENARENIHYSRNEDNARLKTCEG